jgi:hypothetical protein
LKLLTVFTDALETIIFCYSKTHMAKKPKPTPIQAVPLEVLDEMLVSANKVTPIGKEPDLPIKNPAASERGMKSLNHANRIYSRIRNLSDEAPLAAGNRTPLRLNKIHSSEAILYSLADKQMPSISRLLFFLATLMAFSSYAFTSPQATSSNQLVLAGSTDGFTAQLGNFSRGKVDPSSLKLTVGGTDVTQATKITPSSSIFDGFDFEYTPYQLLKAQAGLEGKLEGKTLDGKVFSSSSSVDVVAGFASPPLMVYAAPDSCSATKF